MKYPLICSIFPKIKKGIKEICNKNVREIQPSRK